MNDFEPGVRRALTISNIVSLSAMGMMLLGAAVRQPWTSIPAGVGFVLFGADFIYSRRLMTLGWGPAARERVRPPSWHRWIGGIALIAGGCWVLLQGLLQ